MKRKLYMVLLALAMAWSVQAQSLLCNQVAPKYEVRAVWLTTIGGIDWPHSYAQSAHSAEKQKRELTDILDRLQAAHINTVLIQTRVRGTMIYPSAYEPWDGCLSGFPGILISIIIIIAGIKLISGKKEVLAIEDKSNQ